jgi:hypothetical protein
VSIVGRGAVEEYRKNALTDEQRIFNSDRVKIGTDDFQIEKLVSGLMEAGVGSGFVHPPIAESLQVVGFLFISIGYLVDHGVEQQGKVGNGHKHDTVVHKAIVVEPFVVEIIAEDRHNSHEYNTKHSERHIGFENAFDSVAAIIPYIAAAAIGDDVEDIQDQTDDVEQHDGNQADVVLHDIAQTGTMFSQRASGYRCSTPCDEECEDYPDSDDHDQAVVGVRNCAHLRCEVSRGRGHHGNRG